MGISMWFFRFYSDLLLPNMAMLDQAKNVVRVTWRSTFWDMIFQLQELVDC